MMRADHLKAKSLQVECAYSRELKRACDSAKGEERSRIRAKNHDKRFWSEVRTSQSPSTPGSNQQTVANLDRIRREYEQLHQAHASHASDSRTLQSDLAQLACAQKRKEYIGELLTKFRRGDTGLKESRLSDELADLAILAKPRLTRGSPFHQQIHAPGSTSGNETATHSTLISFPGVARLDATHTRPLESLAITDKLLPPATAQVSSISQRASDIEVSRLSLQHHGSSVAISVSCELRGAGSITLSLSRAKDGAIKVTLDPTMSSLAATLGRERPSVLARLQGLGIKVTSFELQANLDTESNLPRGFRRTRGEVDEDIIT